ncbi:hypothetical protein CIB48_g5815 [Xylaria polymorpha]|nr:hypothetical protein CIB48_g5815 [Xylaria polymorpha]
MANNESGSGPSEPDKCPFKSALATTDINPYVYLVEPREAFSPTHQDDQLFQPCLTIVICHRNRAISHYVLEQRLVIHNPLAGIPHSNLPTYPVKQKEGLHTPKSSGLGHQSGNSSTKQNAMRFHRILPVLLGILATSASTKTKPRDAILLSDVQSLTLRAEKQTTHRRVSAIPQLRCISNQRVCALHTVDVMRCTNQGSSYGAEDVEWSCAASLPPELKLGATDVICEGYASPDDPYVLRGSCGVEYRLVLTELGEQKFPDVAKAGSGGWFSGWGGGGGGKSEPRLREDVDSNAGSWLFGIIFVGVLLWILYSAWTQANAPGAAPRRPRNASMAALRDRTRRAGVQVFGPVWLEVPPQVISQEIAGTHSRTTEAVEVVVDGVRDRDQVQAAEVGIPVEDRLRLRDTQAQGLGPLAEDRNNISRHWVSECLFEFLVSRGKSQLEASGSYTVDYRSHLTITSSSLMLSYVHSGLLTTASSEASHAYASLVATSTTRV